MKEVVTEYSRLARNQRKLPYKTWRAFNQLAKAGYAVEVKSPYHLHVRRKGDHLLVNVWPTAEKIMVQYDAGATVYTHLLSHIKKLFDRAVQSEQPVDQEAIDKHRSMLEKLQKEINGS